MHILEAGNGDDRPVLLLLHGFPELAYMWRKVMIPLADQGYHVIAPDQRGYGRTTDSKDDNGDDLSPFSMLNMCQDIVTLLHRLGKMKVRSVMGRDIGLSIAANLALLRPDIFESLVMMSAQYSGVPEIDAPPRAPVIHSLKQLGKKHYQWYFSSVNQADSDMNNAEQGLKEFFRGYFYFKSAQHPKNKDIFELKEWTPDELCKLPEYYVMQLGKTMPQTVLGNVPASSVLQREMSSWLTEDDLQVYVNEFQRSSFRGGLQRYKCMTSDYDQNQFKVFSGMSIKCPAMYIAGANDWGTQLEPGSLKKIITKDVCEDFRGLELIGNAGHWLLEEQPEKTVKAIVKFLNGIKG